MIRDFARVIFWGVLFLFAVADVQQRDEANVPTEWSSQQ